MINTIKKNFIDYDSCTNFSYKKLYDTSDEFDVTVIIPVRNRFEFLELLLNTLINSEKNGLKVNYIVVEHSFTSIHSKTCLKYNINYVHIRSHSFQIFNKCLCFNMGVFLSNKSKFLMFHDLDCLIQKDFFTNLYENINYKNAKAIQSFNGRRVLYCNEQITSQLLNNEIKVDDLTINSDGIFLPENVGAPGGSVVIDYDLFFDVGGFDPELFQGYAPEDVFFWDKILLLNDNKFEICNEPINEIYHLNHPPQINNNPFYINMINIYNEFNRLDINKKIEIINYKSELIKKYKKI